MLSSCIPASLGLFTVCFVWLCCCPLDRHLTCGPTVLRLIVLARSIQRSMAVTSRSSAWPSPRLTMRLFSAGGDSVAASKKFSGGVSETCCGRSMPCSDLEFANAAGCDVAAAAVAAAALC